ncbi:Predicted enzyme involved in methoxymalonyl-ACP biosynthesis [Lentzea waywayandensis]|uniref:Predicted enzyme involved in methoxymalonyl-ACP biosynthesis n=1 Tax=Lentzea waywayandensis TaxID=84724 RepID=A0A1I6FDL2_9PSEU|nr:hypothetical protein [Lentzea waywayandensis]SFR28069.1 Predicted enzyme involved in methoxymalonyl-ACP biosynthesis [Lentzea waywayandensis]
MRPAEPAVALRARWQRTKDSQPAPELTIGLLASYTIDPVVPYLQLLSSDVDLPVAATVGPFGQIMAQCLDDHGEMARLRPDVLVVAPRLEDLPAGALDGAGAADELIGMADAVLAAAGRWECCPLFVLPALPWHAPNGVGDAGRADGVMATANAARAALRAHLSGRPGVLVADAEEAVRTVGTSHAFHPVMYRFARIPYSEEVFRELGANLARLLRIRYAGRPRTALVDASSLLESLMDDSVVTFLADLRAAGFRLVLRATGDPEALWDTVVGAAPQLAHELLDGWVVDARPATEQLAGVVADAGRLLVLTADPALAALAEDVDGASALLLDVAPESWSSAAHAAGVFDWLPGGAVRVPERRDRPAAALSLQDYIAGLAVSVGFHEVTAGLRDKAVEIVARAKDFVFGLPDPSGRLTATPGRQVFAAKVTDRTGDYGFGAVVGMDCAGDRCTVDLLSISCPVMGRGVEDTLLDEIVRRAGDGGCDTVELCWQATGRNGVAVEFVEAATRRTWTSPTGREIKVRGVEVH